MPNFSQEKALSTAPPTIFSGGKRSWGGGRCQRLVSRLTGGEERGERRGNGEVVEIGKAELPRRPLYRLRDLDAFLVYLIWSKGSLYLLRDLSKWGLSSTKIPSVSSAKNVSWSLGSLPGEAWSCCLFSLPERRMVMWFIICVDLRFVQFVGGGKLNGLCSLHGEVY